VRGLLAGQGPDLDQVVGEYPVTAPGCGSGAQCLVPVRLISRDPPVSPRDQDDSSTVKPGVTAP
jgi:hypothetical protein